jgi:hypothetical protein
MPNSGHIPFIYFIVSRMIDTYTVSLKGEDMKKYLLGCVLFASVSTYNVFGFSISIDNQTPVTIKVSIDKGESFAIAKNGYKKFNDPLKCARVVTINAQGKILKHQLGNRCGLTILRVYTEDDTLDSLKAEEAIIN